MVFGKLTEGNMAAASGDGMRSVGLRTAGLRSPFLAAEKFEGNRPGYHYTEGKHGKGYYIDMRSDDNFLARLAQAEKRDDHHTTATATGGAPSNGERLGYRYIHQSQHTADYRQQHAVEQQRPEWARVQAEGLTESTIAYQVPKKGDGIERVGPSRQRRSQFGPLPSQIDFGQMGLPLADDRGQFVTSHEVEYRNGYRNEYRNANQKAAGGRSNLAGPTNGNGERKGMIGHGVNFLS